MFTIFTLNCQQSVFCLLVYDNLADVVVEKGNEFGSDGLLGVSVSKQMQQKLVVEEVVTGECSTLLL